MRIPKNASFEELRRLRYSNGNGPVGGGGKLFEKDWEVFVARYDAETGRYRSMTICCEARRDYCIEACI